MDRPVGSWYRKLKNIFVTRVQYLAKVLWRASVQECGVVYSALLVKTGSVVLLRNSQW